MEMLDTYYMQYNMKEVCPEGCPNACEGPSL